MPEFQLTMRLGSVESLMVHSSRGVSISSVLFPFEIVFLLYQK